IFFSNTFQYCVWLIGAAIFAAWVWPETRASSRPNLTRLRSPLLWLRSLLFATGMGAIVLLVYYLPMMQHFWGGYDEVLCLIDETRGVWCWYWDQLGRPTWGIASHLGYLLTPDNIDGLLWVTGVLCLLNGLLLTGIVRRLLPGETAIA